MRKFENTVQSETAPSTNSIWIKGGTQYFFNNGEWESLAASADLKELEEKVDSLDKEMGEVKNDISKFGSSQGVVELQIGDSSSVTSANLKALQSIQSTDHTFLTDINYGYGTGSWIPGTGGNATIFTSAGHMVNYDITAKGEVIKTGESEVGEATYKLAVNDALYYPATYIMQEDEATVKKFLDEVRSGNIPNKIELSSFDVERIILIRNKSLGEELWTGIANNIDGELTVWKLRADLEHNKLAIEQKSLELANTGRDGLMSYTDKLKLNILSEGQEGQVLTRDTSTDIGIAWKNLGISVKQMFSYYDQDLSKYDTIQDFDIVYDKYGNVTADNKLNILNGENPDILHVSIMVENEVAYLHHFYLYRNELNVDPPLPEWCEYAGYYLGYLWTASRTGDFDRAVYGLKRSSFNGGVAVKQIAAPATLSESASNAEVIARVNSIINGLISSGTFKG